MRRFTGSTRLDTSSDETFEAWCFNGDRRTLEEFAETAADADGDRAAPSTFDVERTLRAVYAEHANAWNSQRPAVITGFLRQSAQRRAGRMGYVE